jgi:hypothetical protein
MEVDRITKAHNQCAQILNNSDLTQTELVVTLAQLLIYSGESITKKEIDVRDLDLEELEKEYYANNKENDIGLGLILNGASIMGAISNFIKGNVTANKENHNDNQVSTTTKISQKNSSASDRSSKT